MGPLGVEIKAGDRVLYNSRELTLRLVRKGEHITVKGMLDGKLTCPFPKGVLEQLVHQVEQRFNLRATSVSSNDDGGVIFEFFSR